MPDWFEKGLRFECAKCGACCRGEPGYVWINGAEAVAIAGFLRMSIDVFSANCVRDVGKRVSLIEKPNGDCVFWESAIGCRIYPVRPTQCRTWPFWEENIAGPRTWERAGQKCAGIGRGRVYRADDIRKRAARTS